MKKQLLCVGMILVLGQMGAAANFRRSQGNVLKSLRDRPEPSKRSVLWAALKHPVNTVKVFMNKSPEKAARREIDKLSNKNILKNMLSENAAMKSKPLREQTDHEMYYRFEAMPRLAKNSAGEVVGLNEDPHLQRKLEVAKEVIPHISTSKRIVHYNEYKKAIKEGIQQEAMKLWPNDHPAIIKKFGKSQEGPTTLLSQVKQNKNITKARQDAAYNEQEQVRKEGLKITNSNRADIEKIMVGEYASFEVPEIVVMNTGSKESLLQLKSIMEKNPTIYTQDYKKDILTMSIEDGILKKSMRDKEGVDVSKLTALQNIRTAFPEESQLIISELAPRFLNSKAPIAKLFFKAFPDVAPMPANGTHGTLSTVVESPNKTLGE